MTRNLLIAFFIISISIIYGLPHLIMFSKLGTTYFPLSVSEGVSRVTHDESFIYAPEVNFVLRGNFFLREPYVVEYSNLPTPYIGETIPALTIALLSIITGSIPSAFVSSDFIFPTIIFVLLFFLAKIFIKNNLYALTASLVTVISRDYIAVIPYPSAIWNYFNSGEGPGYFLYLSRAFHPQLSFAFFLLAILVAFKMIISPNNKTAILLGLALGLLFYTYIFYWSYLLIFIFLVLVYGFYKKDLQILKFFSITLVVGVLMGSFYFYNILNFFQLDIASDFLGKTSIDRVSLNTVIFRYLLVGILFVVVVSKKKMIHWALFILILTGVLIPLLSNLLLGKDLESMHYIRRALIPISSITGFIIVYHLANRFVSKSQYLFNLIPLVTISIFIIFAIKIQLTQSIRSAEDYKTDPDLTALIGYLNTVIKKDDVIGAFDKSTNTYVSLYTKGSIFLPQADRTIMPTWEGMDRYITLSDLLGISKKNQKAELNLAFIYYYKSFNKNYEYDPPAWLIQQARAKIDKTDVEEIRDNLKKYKLDFVVVGPDDYSNIHPNLNLLMPLTTVNGYVIFEIIR